MTKTRNCLPDFTVIISSPTTLKFIALIETSSVKKESRRDEPMKTFQKRSKFKNLQGRD